jgi:hypothetical protein
MYAIVQIANRAPKYRRRMKTIPASASAGHPIDFTMAVHVNPAITYEWSKVLLARASFNGHFELLTAAWEKLLGYGRQEFSAKTLGELMVAGGRCPGLRGAGRPVRRRAGRAQPQALIARP